jgi:uncharacterized protein
LHDLGEKILDNIDKADITKFDLMKVIGKQMAEYISATENNFRENLVDNKFHDKLVTSSGDIIRTKKQMSNSQWLDNFID